MVSSRKLDSVPDLTDLVAEYPRQYPFLLDSTATGPLGRYSILLRAGQDFLCLDEQGSLTGPGSACSFLGRLKQWYKRDSKVFSEENRWPFIGGWFVYLAYELAGEIEPVLDLPPPGDGLPVALAVRCEAAVIIEHGEEETAHLVAERADILREMQDEISGARSPVSSEPAAGINMKPEPDHQYTDAVKRIQDYLASGDVFQVNLSRSWTGAFEVEGDAIGIYRRLRRSNPAPFAGLMNWEGRALMSSSPERLVGVRQRLVQTRPIAGTYPRGEDRNSDRALSRDMLAHPKERAEHIMLIDLERNDLGRVCDTGTVEVSELMVVESYSHVHHIVSNIRGRLKRDADPVDVIRAVFPGGTITGCPKVRCMQIIAELEQRGRGFYTGSMGYISRDGQMDLNILIRSMLLSGKQMTVRTGAGIVVDSQPDRELAETTIKARGMLLALEAPDV